VTARSNILLMKDIKTYRHNVPGSLANGMRLSLLMKDPGVWSRRSRKPAWMYARSTGEL
jgi:hypothetical protein